MNENVTVALTPCPDYEVSKIREILHEDLTNLGVLSRVRPGMKIAVKLNLVSAMKPDAAGTTHPAVIEALCQELISLGAEVVLGDSPGGPFTGAYLNTVYRVCGIKEAAERSGAKLNEDFTQTDVTFPDGVIAKTITVTTWLLNADLIINCCKLKTHGMMALSAAVKNMFGCIPGTMKPEYHFRFPKQENFADMLVDLQEYWKPKMLCHVVDGITGMEGNGPTAGTPRQVGVLLTGTDPYALDLVGGRIIGLEPDRVLTMQQAILRNLSERSADTVRVRFGTREVPGTKENLAQFTISDYQLLDKERDLQFGGESAVKRVRSVVIRKLLSSRPQVEKSECIGCRKCEQICPAHAIQMKNQKPVIRRDLCIKCFCCQEFCPKGAMKVRRTPIAKVLAH